MPSSLGPTVGLGHWHGHCAVEAWPWVWTSLQMSWHPKLGVQEEWVLPARGGRGADSLCLCSRPHVCAEQELTLVGRRQPCVQAFSHTVPVWKAGCGWQAWCVGHERR